jgi:hypothetical protein
LKEYIDFNTNIRKKSNNICEKDQAKLMNNSIFGKSMENILGRPNYKLLGKNNMKIINKIMRSNDYISEFIVNENIVLFELNKKEIEYNKPTYVGFTILELSKYWLYNLIYNVIKKHFDDVTISYVDTDSCIFETSSGKKLKTNNRSL